MERLSTLLTWCLIVAATWVAPIRAQNSGCHAMNARNNLTRALKSGVDFVPITPDDSLGFYCVYSVKFDGSFTVGIFLFPLGGRDILMFGAGYGVNSFEGTAIEAAEVDAVLRSCLGRQPGTSRIHFVAPHGHADHINDALLGELRSMGWRFADISYHAADAGLVELLNWADEARAVFRELTGTQCGEEILAYPSPLGKVWFTPRPGHTDGAIDLIIDIRNDPANRVCVRGSVAGGPCPPPAGVQMFVDAHGTVFLPPNGNLVRARAEVVNGSGVNRVCLMTDSAPRIGTRWQAEVDPAGHSGATALILFGYMAPLDTGIMLSAGELLLDTNPNLFLYQAAQSAQQRVFQIDVPNDPAILGYEGWFQALMMGGGAELCNALHVKLGS